MDERQEAWNIARIWLDRSDRFGAMDPDGDQCVLARSYLRAPEKIERLTLVIERLTPAEHSLTRAELADKWPKAVQP